MKKNIVSVDGKESMGSKRKSGEQGEVRALQTLNVYSNDHGICLAQKFIDEKTNEIPAAPYGNTISRKTQAGTVNGKSGKN